MFSFPIKERAFQIRMLFGELESWISQSPIFFFKISINMIKKKPYYLPYRDKHDWNFILPPRKLINQFTVYEGWAWGLCDFASTISLGWQSHSWINFAHVRKTSLDSVFWDERSQHFPSTWVPLLFTRSSFQSCWMQCCNGHCFVFLCGSERHQHRCDVTVVVDKIFLVPWSIPLNVNACIATPAILCILSISVYKKVIFCETVGSCWTRIFIWNLCFVPPHLMSVIFKVGFKISSSCKETDEYCYK